MTRQSRTLLLVAVFAVGGATLLILMAQRYARLLASPAAPASSGPGRGPARPGTDALGLVDAFIEVRQAVRRSLDAAEEPADLALRRARDRALADVGLEPVQYASVRELYREWRAGRRDATHPLLAALEIRSRQLRAVDLGDRERLD